VIKRIILDYAQGLRKIIEAGWFSLQLQVIHRMISFEKKSPIYPQVELGLYMQGQMKCG